MLEEKGQKLPDQVGEEESAGASGARKGRSKRAGKDPGEAMPEKVPPSRKKAAATKETGKNNTNSGAGPAMEKSMAEVDDSAGDKGAPAEATGSDQAGEVVADGAIMKADTETAPAESSDEATPGTTQGEPIQTGDGEKEDPGSGKETEDVLNEIEESNAEDAEDEDNQHRHHITFQDYHAMSMENLVGELQRLVRNEKVQAIKRHVDTIKYEFDHKFQEFLDHKKEEFIAKGGNEIDFKYTSVTKRQFNEVYSDYREKRTQYYKNLDQSLKANLNTRLELIEELRGLVNVEEDINTTYKSFKEIQESWRNAGPVPRNNYNDVWRTYQHHIEIFYDFLHLNRELRDLDFKHNLEEKEKIVERAEGLAEEPDLNKAFRELQSLHKIWKEDIGPVGQEQRDAIWDRFSNATKALHQRRQDHYKELEVAYEENLEKKNEIIAGIREISEHIAGSHKTLQEQIRKIEALREAFFKAGKVPQSENEKTWATFKDAVRAFNRNKNAYYKNLKQGQQENLEKKRALLHLAVSLQDSEDWDMATKEMKRIQGEWKNIGHVPRKYSDKIWNEFKSACNHYFDRLHALKNTENKAEYENFEGKNSCLEKLKSYELTGNKKKDLTAIKELIEEWKTYGRVPFNKKGVNARFNKILDALFRKLDVGRQESELLKYGNKIQQLANSEDERAILDERTFIRRKIDESKSELRQLENNLQFFSNASEENPLVREVVQNIDRHKEALATWKAKLKKLNILENSLNKETADDSNGDSPDSEEE